MDIKVVGLERGDGDQGCIFPVLDSDGKRRRICGESTPILDASGNKRAFCAKHAQILSEWIRHKKAQKKRGDTSEQKKMYLKRGEVYKNIL